MNIKKVNNSDLFFTVIISTYNRPDCLKQAVTSVLKQTYPNFELIVVDDASKKDPKAAIGDFSDSRIIYMRNEKNRGISATRNSALKKSKGDYIVLIDDDTVLKADFLERLEKIAAAKEIGALCPRILDPVTKKPFIPFFLYNQNKYLNHFNFNFFIGLAHIISKEVLEKVGYYDERFGVGARYHSSEESDYFFRLKQAGQKVLYCPDLVAYHPKEVDPSANKVFLYSYGISAMLVKNFISDIAHGWSYLLIFVKRLLVSLLRTYQYVLSPARLESKNKQYKYRHFLGGTITGFFDYLRFR